MTNPTGGPNPVRPNPALATQYPVFSNLTRHEVINKQTKN